MSQIHHEVTFAAPPARVYAALTKSDQFSAVTGAPAEIASAEGGAYSAFGGHIHGRTVALVDDRRIVWAWRAKTWPEGVYSIARVELAADGGGTRMTFDQDGVPAETVEHIDAGWHKMYWEPVRTYVEG
jgi:activator of HSP90 ATPase